jgi:hypothetical protein
MGLPGIRGAVKAQLAAKGKPNPYTNPSTKSDWIRVQSSNVKAIRFFRQVWMNSKVMGHIEIWFKNNMIYTYLADLRTFNALLSAGSKGKAVHRLLVPRGYINKRGA